METLFPDKGGHHEHVRSPFGGIPRNWKQSTSKLTQECGPRSSPFGGIPRNWKRSVYTLGYLFFLIVPPSGGSLEIGNNRERRKLSHPPGSSPFGGIPRNWKRSRTPAPLPTEQRSSPFGGIPRNWKPTRSTSVPARIPSLRSPFGGIPRNWKHFKRSGSEETTLMFPLRGDP